MRSNTLVLHTILLTLLCLCLPLAASAQTRGPESRDYFLPGELPAEAGSVRTLETPDKRAGTVAQADAVAASFPAASTIQYRAFDGLTYTLRAYSGKYVRWAVPDSWLGAGGLSAADVRQLVDLTDVLYAHMAELAGGEPAGAGLLTIAAVELGPHAGLGYVGLKGVEVGLSTFADLKKFLAAGQLNGVVYHELSHNFDIHSSYLSYYGDFAHAWTTFFHFYAQAYARAGDYDLAPDYVLPRNIAWTLKAWDKAGAAASWEGCVRGGGGCEGLGIRANDAWGGLMLRFARLHGPAAVRRVFDYLKSNRGLNAPPLTAEDKNDLLVKALAYGAGANVACEMDAWHWSVSPAARLGIAQQYTAQNPACADADLDGYSRARGDYDDNSQAVHPGAVETRNGVDDDCNDVVDDLLVKEPAAGDFPNPQSVGYPGRISGRITTGEGDPFTVTLAAPRKVTFKLCSESDFQGWLFVYKSDGSWLGYQYVFKGECTTSTYNLNAAGTWRFEVAYNSSSLPGSYSLQYYDNKQWPAPWGTTVAPVAAGGSYPLTSKTQTLAGALKTPTHVRFWVAGFGFVGTVPYAQTAVFNWAPPAGTAPGSYGYRAQLFAASIPVEAPTASQPFNVTSASVSLSSLTLSPASVAGGNAVTGTVTLSGPAPAGGAVVALSDNLAATTVPASVTVAAGTSSKTFTIATARVAASQSGAVTATYAGASKTAALVVRPPVISSLVLSPAVVLGGKTVTGTVTLDALAPAGGTVVTLSDNLAATTLPPSVTVAAGTRSKTFIITTSAVTLSQRGSVTAATGAVTKSAGLTVDPVKLNALLLNPVPVVGGGAVTGTVTLNGPAPAGGAVVKLTDTLSAATPPASVTVPAGATSKAFAIATTAVAATQTGTVTATRNGVSKTATLTVSPP